MIHLYETDRLPNKAKIEVIDPLDLVGQQVSVHYNLNRCSPRKESKEGETCFVVRDKPSGKTKGYVREIALADVTTVVRPGTLGRIRKREEREVCCFIRGTVIDFDDLDGDLWEGGFNPFRKACFYLLDDGQCVDAAAFVLFEGRSFWFVDPVTSSPEAAEARVPNGSDVTPETLDPEARYTIWERAPSGRWVVLRSYYGVYFQGEGAYFLDWDTDAYYVTEEGDRPPGWFDQNPSRATLPKKAGTTITVEGPEGRVLRVKKLKRGSYFLRVGGEQRGRFGDSREAREDMGHFLESGALPREKTSWANPRAHERKVGDRVLDRMNQRRWGYVRELAHRGDGVPTYIVWWSDVGLGTGWTDYDLVTPKGRSRRKNPSQAARRLTVR